MKNHKRLIELTLPFAKENRFSSWYFTLSTLFILLTSLIATLIEFHWLIRIILSVFSGLVIVRLFVIYHDYLHGTILMRSKTANLLFTLFGYYILAPKTIWKRSHDFHHNQNSKLFRSGIGSYPVFTKSRFEQLSKKDKAQYLFIRHPLVILFGYYFTFLNGMCLQTLSKSFRKHLDSLFALIFHVMIHSTIFIYFGWKSFIFFSVVPHLISGAIGAYLFYVQHNFPLVHYDVDENWTYEGAALESSSYLDTNRFMHWVTANIGYHHIHHLNSNIPFYRLPEIMSKVEVLQNPKTTTLSLKDIIACLQLKVWDVEEKRMVGVSKK